MFLGCARIQHVAPDLAGIWAPATATPILKRAVPAAGREWDPDLRCWLVDHDHLPDVREALTAAGYTVRGPNLDQPVRTRTRTYAGPHWPAPTRKATP